jgi:hypothetical protein
MRQWNISPGFTLAPDKDFAVSLPKLLPGLIPEIQGIPSAFRLRASLFSPLTSRWTAVSRYLLGCSDFPHCASLRKRARLPCLLEQFYYTKKTGPVNYQAFIHSFIILVYVKAQVKMKARPSSPTLKAVFGSCPYCPAPRWPKRQPPCSFPWE